MVTSYIYSIIFEIVKVNGKLQSNQIGVFESLIDCFFINLNVIASLKHFEKSLSILESQLPAEAASYEAIGLDYIAMLEIIGEDGKASSFKKRMEKVLVAV